MRYSVWAQISKDLCRTHGNQSAMPMADLATGRRTLVSTRSLWGAQSLNVFTPKSLTKWGEIQTKIYVQKYINIRVYFFTVKIALLYFLMLQLLL